MNDDKSLAVREPQTNLTLFGTTKPTAVIEKATELATALADVINNKKLFFDIKGKKHVYVEGWTLCGTMLGVFPVCVWTRKLDNGWEARVEARTQSGAIIGAAEAECLRTESNWATRDDYALRSMAQTRATSKALRLPLGFIMTLAGYEATPAEEMMGIDGEDKNPINYAGWDGTKKIETGKHKGKMWCELPDKSIDFMASEKFSDGPAKDCARAEKARRAGVKGETPRELTPEQTITAEIRRLAKQRNLTNERMGELIQISGIEGQSWKDIAANNDLNTLKILLENVQTEPLNLDEDGDLDV